MARQVDGAFETPLPSARRRCRRGSHLPVLTDEAILAPHFSAEEARRVGLVEESAVDWDGKVDIELERRRAKPMHRSPASAIAGLPAPEPSCPSRRRAASLVDHVQIGFAYQMHLDGEWQKVRLSHVSPGAASSSSRTASGTSRPCR